MLTQEQLEQVVSVLPKIRIIAHRFCRSLPTGMVVVDVDDLIQCAALRLCSVIHRFDPRKSKFTTFAEIQIKGAMLDWMRKIGVTSRSKIGQNTKIYSLDDTCCEDILVDHSSNPMGKVMKSEAVLRFKMAINELPPRLGLVVRLYYFDEMNMYQIAERLGLSQGRVSQMRSEAIQLLFNSRILEDLRMEV